MKLLAVLLQVAGLTAVSCAAGWLFGAAVGLLVGGLASVLVGVVLEREH